MSPSNYRDGISRFFRGTRRQEPSRFEPVDEALLAHPTVNVILIGSPATNAAVLETLLKDITTAEMRVAGTLLPLPSATPQVLIIRHVDRLTPLEQHGLMAWLDTNADAKIVSTSEQPLLPLVETRQFAAMLYYRLNTVCFDLTEAHPTD